MAKQAAGGTELCNSVLSGTFAATGASGTMNFIGYGNFSIWGTPLNSDGTSNTFSATVKLQKSHDGGTTWLPVSIDTSGDPASFTAAVTLPVFEIEPGMIYRFYCSAYSSGTVNYRLANLMNPSLPIYKVS